MSTIKQGFPNLDTPFLDSNGSLTLTWFQFFASLWNRTGGAAGNSSASFNYPASSGNPGQLLTSEGPASATIWTNPVTKTSEITNDSGYITSRDLAGYATQTDSQNAAAIYVTANESDDIPTPDSAFGAPGYSIKISRADHSHPLPRNPVFSGTVSASEFRSGSIGPTWTSGVGAPIGSAVIGSLYSRTDGVTGATLYVYGSAGWKPVAGV